MCEISRNPPVHMTHWLKIKAPPSVSILGKPSSGQFVMREDSELGLVCRGSGEPAPSLTWRREGGPLPDGQLALPGDQLIFSRLSREHGGSYCCTGVTSEGRQARDT